MGEALGRRLGVRHIHHTGPEAYELASRAMNTYDKKGFEWMDRGDYDINLLSLRNSLRNWRNWDDVLYAIYRVDGEWVVEEFSVTTEPQGGVVTRGAVWKKEGRAGTAILQNGQWKAYATGLHRGKPAITQQGIVTVWRDGNSNATLDYENSKGIDGRSGEDTGRFGINVHGHSVADSTVEWKDKKGWASGSAGCTITKYGSEIPTILYPLCDKMNKIYAKDAPSSEAFKQPRWLGGKRVMWLRYTVIWDTEFEEATPPPSDKQLYPPLLESTHMVTSDTLMQVIYPSAGHYIEFTEVPENTVVAVRTEKTGGFFEWSKIEPLPDSELYKKSKFFYIKSADLKALEGIPESAEMSFTDDKVVIDRYIADDEASLPQKPWTEYEIDVPWFDKSLAEHRVSVTSDFESLGAMGAEGSASRNEALQDVLHKGLSKIFEEEGKQHDSDFVYSLILTEKLIFGKVLEHYVDPKTSATARFLVTIEHKYVEPLPDSESDYDFRTEEEQVDYRVLSDNIKEFSNLILKLKPQVDSYEGEVRVYDVKKESQLLLDYKNSFDILLLENGFMQEDLDKLAALPARGGEEGQIVIGWKEGYKASYISIFYENELREIKTGLVKFKKLKEVESVRVQEIIHKIDQYSHSSYSLSQFIQSFVTQDPPEFIPNSSESDAGGDSEALGPPVKTIEDFKKEQNYVDNIARKKDVYEKRKKEKNCTQSSMATKNSLPKTKKAIDNSEKVFSDALNSISIPHLFQNALACLQVPQISNDIEVLSEFLKELPKVPTMFVPDDFPTDDIGAEFMKTLSETLAFMIKNTITGLLKGAIDSILSCKDDDLDSPLKIDPFELSSAISNLGGDGSFDPEEVESFVDGLATFLSSDELCTLLNGEATDQTLQLVQNYIERFYPNLKIRTKSEIENFFITLGGSIDFSICFEALAPQNQFIDPNNLCLEDDELRRRILSEKNGITESEVEDQIARNNNRRKQLADRIKAALNTPPLSGAFETPELFCQRVMGRPINESTPGLVSFADPTFAEMVGTTVDSTFSSFRDKFNQEANDYFNSFFTITSKPMRDPNTGEIVIDPETGTSTLIPTRELLPSLSEFYSNPSFDIEHEIESFKIPIEENYELQGELERFVERSNAVERETDKWIVAIEILFNYFQINEETDFIGLSAALRRWQQNMEQNVEDLNERRNVLIRQKRTMIETENTEDVERIEKEIEAVDIILAERWLFRVEDLVEYQKRLKEYRQRQFQIDAVQGSSAEILNYSPSRELKLRTFSAGFSYDYEISVDSGVFLDPTTGTFPPQVYRREKRLSPEELSFVSSRVPPGDRRPFTLFESIIRRGLGPFQLTQEDYEVIDYELIYKSLKVKFIEEITKKLNTSPYFKNVKANKKAIELIELVTKATSPECDNHVLRLKTLIDEIKKNFSEEFCVDADSLEGKPSKTPFETELMRACIRLTIRHYILEGLLRSIISNSVFATSELEEAVIFDFTFDLMKSEMQRYGSYYDDFLNEVGEYLLDPDLLEPPSPEGVMIELFESEFKEIKLAFEIAIMKPKGLTQTVKDFFINKILLDTEEIINRQNIGNDTFENHYHKDLVVQRAVRFHFGDMTSFDENLSPRNNVFYEHEDSESLEERVRDYAQELIGLGVSKQEIRDSIQSYYVVCLVDMAYPYYRDGLESFNPDFGFVNNPRPARPSAEKAFLTPDKRRIVIPLFETKRKPYTMVFSESPTHRSTADDLRQEERHLEARYQELYRARDRIWDNPRNHYHHDMTEPLLPNRQAAYDAIVTEIDTLLVRLNEIRNLIGGFSQEEIPMQEITDFEGVSLSFKNNTNEYALQELKLSAEVSVLLDYIFPLEIYKSSFIIYEMSTLSLISEVRNALLVSRDELNILFYTITPEADDWKKIAKPMQENSSEDILAAYQFNFGLQLGSCKSDLAWNFGLDVDWGNAFKGLSLGAAAKAASDAALQVFKDYVEKNDPNIKLAVYLSKLQRLACIDVSPTENSLGLSIANPLLYGPNPLNAAYNALGLGNLNKKGSKEQPNVEGLERRDICEELAERDSQESNSDNDE